MVQNQKSINERRYADRFYLEDSEGSIGNVVDEYAGVVAAAINAKAVLKMVLQHGCIDDSESRMSAVASAITDLEANGV